MKIAISLPDEVFRGVERAAKRLGISRSELLARAAGAFLEEQLGRDVTKSYDAAFGGDPAGANGDGGDSFRRAAARRALLDVEW